MIGLTYIEILTTIHIYIYIACIGRIIPSAICKTLCNKQHAFICRLQKLKPDYTQTEDLVVDVLALRYKDMSYHRELLLPDVLHEPVSEHDDDDHMDSLEVVIPYSMRYATVVCPRVSWVGSRG